MRKMSSLTLLFILILGCQNMEPNFAHIILEEQSDQNTPQLDILLRENTLSIQIKWDGTSIYDTGYLLADEQAKQLYMDLKEMGINIYSEETPQWKNRKATFLKDSQFETSSRLALKLQKFDKQYNTLYSSYVNAAEVVAEEANPSDAQIIDNAKLLDSLKAD